MLPVKLEIKKDIKVMTTLNSSHSKPNKLRLGAIHMYLILEELYIQSYGIFHVADRAWIKASDVFWYCFEEVT